MIHWLVEPLQADPHMAQGAAPPGLLSPDEVDTLARLQTPKRRQEWLLGRWTAKNLVRAYLQASADRLPPPDRVAIRNAADGVPYVTLLEDEGEQRLPVSLSISHSHGLAFCALHPEAGNGVVWRVGADIEYVETRDDSFVVEFFTTEERRLVAQAAPGEQALLVTAIWSGKEALLKALATGLRLNTRRVECAMGPSVSAMDEWVVWAPRVQAPAHLFGAPALRWSGWWRRPAHYPDHVMTMALLEMDAPALQE